MVTIIINYCEFLETHNISFSHKFCDCSVSFSKHAVYGKSHCLQIYAVILKLLSRDVVANVAVHKYSDKNTWLSINKWHVMSGNDYKTVYHELLKIIAFQPSLIQPIPQRKWLL
jgi:hypothetical protein